MQGIGKLMTPKVKAGYISYAANVPDYFSKPKYNKKKV